MDPDCAIPDCDEPALSTYPYSGPLAHGPRMSEKLVVYVSLCEEHAKGRPDRLSCEDST
jgi:hypothetical protein